MGLARLAGAAFIAALALAATPEAKAQGAADTGTAVFAGGCFWCVEEAFDKVRGVTETTSGYTGGHVRNPTYEQVSGKGTGHKEAVRVRYNPSRVSYEKLLDVFWRNVDPFDSRGQFCDKGDSYKSAIFVANAAQRKLAEESKQAVQKRFGRRVATKIEPAATFWPAEKGHQNYYREHPYSYKFYKWNCGRAQRLEQIWGKPSS
ncbi:MAG TPA: peptide-methionine (S)-S-oxide reductase MsrA [Hyphomicrobiales bacterium]|nr:peptide-methionine (S)-S-oxide reductase MsrA [Hyphomicrobiales bacterium]